MAFWHRNKKQTATKPAEVEVRTGFLSTHADQIGDGDPYSRFVVAMRQSFQAPMVPKLRQIEVAGIAMDAVNNLATPALTSTRLGPVPLQQLEWYAGQGFIGWQMAALLSQNWLIDKACAMPGKDAIRHGWELAADQGKPLSPEQMAKLKDLDKRYRIDAQLMEFSKMGRVFGIRHALFLIDGIDYEAPFNPDGIKPGSFQGISQIDPYWIAPLFDGEAAANPAAPDFYEPTYWQVNGRRVHRSHFVITRNGDEVPDILKPSYFYGGIPIPQKIYERVFCAERTANEAPLLAMSKRLTSLKVNTKTAMANLKVFEQEMERWSKWQNNFGIKAIDHADEITQFDTSLTGLDETVMTQFQLVAAAANVPATKLLGTQPKGFNASGEYEATTYHEELESIQENDLTPFLDRYYTILLRSELGSEDAVHISWNPVDSPTAKEAAEIREIDSRTDKNLADAGALDGFDIRTRVSQDKDSGYAGIPEVVPDGPGDRDAEKERQEAEAAVTAKEGTGEDDVGLSKWDAAAGTWNGARIITHQKFLDPQIVSEKRVAGDYLVHVTPEFEKDGKKYRMVVDGHHSLAAAVEAGENPVFSEELPREELINAATREATDAATPDKA